MKSFNKTIRSLHRDLGYFVIGLTLIYAITGIILSGRGLGWLQQNFNSNLVIENNISNENFNKAFINVILSGKINKIFPKDSYSSVKKHLNLKLIREEDGFSYFRAWKSLKVKYENSSGKIDVKYRGYPITIEIFLAAHKASHESAWFYLAIIYSLILSFLAISSFWMLKGKNGFKRRGVYLMLAGFVVVFLFLFFG